MAGVWGTMGPRFRGDDRNVCRGTPYGLINSFARSTVAFGVA
jgi:hypothetical protein